MVRYRWLLPLAQCSIDVVLVGLLIYQAHGAWSASKGALRQMTAAEPIDLQEIPGAQFNLRFIDVPIPEPFTLVVFGVLPVGLLSTAVVPDAAWPTRDRYRSGKWFAVHEVFTFAIWFGVGAMVDRGARTLLRWFVALVGIRLAGFGWLLWRPFARLVILILALYWIAAVLTAIYHAGVRSIRRIRNISSP